MKTFVAIFIFLAAVAQIEASKPVKVTVFYESLCGDSKRFIKKQLYPTYSKLKNYMDVELVPFGKAYITTSPWRITCQHGPAECLGNALQACAFARNPDTEIQVNIANCFMSDREPATADKRCNTKIQYNSEGVEECSKNEEGRQLLVQNRDRTKVFKERLSFVPTVLFNDVHDDKDQKDALSNLRSVICRKLEPYVPEECTER